jgi:hypothetical protein
MEECKTLFTYTGLGRLSEFNSFIGQPGYPKADVSKDDTITPYLVYNIFNHRNFHTGKREDLIKWIPLRRVAPPHKPRNAHRLQHKP